MTPADHLLLVLAEITRAHLVETVEHAHADVARLDAAARAVQAMLPGMIRRQCPNCGARWRGDVLSVCPSCPPLRLPLCGHPGACRAPLCGCDREVGGQTDER